MMRHWFATLTLLLCSAACSAQNYAEGQVWAYKTRKGEEASTVLINKIENDAKGGKIFHISVLGVKVKNRQAASGVSTELPHFPVSQQTLDASLTQYLRKARAHPQYASGYNTWKNAHTEGKAGVFTVGVAEIVDIVETALN